MTLSLSEWGLNDSNIPINKERLLYRLSERYTGDIKELMKVLANDPDKANDKKAFMRKTGKESTINSTTGQALGSAIDNLPYYVDSSAWWIKGWNGDKYKANVRRRGNIYKAKPKKRIMSKCAKYMKDKEL